MLLVAFAFVRALGCRGGVALWLRERGGYFSERLGIARPAGDDGLINTVERAQCLAVTARGVSAAAWGVRLSTCLGWPGGAAAGR